MSEGDVLGWHVMNEHFSFQICLQSIFHATCFLNDLYKIFVESIEIIYLNYVPEDPSLRY